MAVSRINPNNNDDDDNMAMRVFIELNNQNQNLSLHKSILFAICYISTRNIFEIKDSESIHHSSIENCCDTILVN
ncbi:hypothetical protein DERF_005991 [Dermatophagoides farinae]|uniref:Uncharacterized protein n=1 Tax=Dermatophagoides farinae TaxID=6954 RepID=A0A922L992_DERFA|nr:hypothetical protein DERF_005991 [Dermatophagoides farinae]